jgi:2-keto-4-pentenoate hydratase/2-oxohepta-3-ene-1,7-dioic acid hydratase in catechol pathway
MKLVRYGNPGEEKPGLIDNLGNLLDLSNHMSDLNPQTLGNQELMEGLKTLDSLQLSKIDSSARLGACLSSPGKIICIGYNSRLHTQQMGMTPLSEKDMLVFMKPTSALCGPFDPILYTRHTKKLDWEAELGIIIGKKGKYISKKSARHHILGYTCINDLSDRFLQLETGDSQYTKGKGFDNAAPIGPYLVTKDEIHDPHNLQVKLWVNGHLRQDFNTKDYLHNDEDVVSYLSQYFTLYPGDVISMGSGPGTAKSWGEELYLKPNDKVIFSIEGLGQQEKTVINE